MGSDYGTFKIFISNLPSGYTNDQLFDLFQEHGTVVECEVFDTKNFAFVHMSDEESGKKAIEALNEKFVAGSKISVSAAKSTKSGPKHILNSTMMEDVSRTFKLFVSGLPKDITKDKIQSMLEEFGRIVEVEIYKTSAAFVHMEDETDAKNAIASLHGSLLDGHKISVCHARNPEGPSVPIIKLLVKNITSNVTAQTLKDLFKPYGMVICCCINPSMSGDLRNAVVQLEALGDIRSAIKDVNGYELEGSKLEVQPLLDNSQSPKKPSDYKSNWRNESGRKRGQPGRGTASTRYQQRPPLMGAPPPLYESQNIHGRARGRGRGFSRGGRRGGGVGGSFRLVPMPSSTSTYQDLYNDYRQLGQGYQDYSEDYTEDYGEDYGCDHQHNAFKSYSNNFECQATDFYNSRGTGSRGPPAKRGRGTGVPTEGMQSLMDLSFEDAKPSLLAQLPVRHQIPPKLMRPVEDWTSDSIPSYSTAYPLSLTGAISSPVGDDANWFSPRSSSNFVPKNTQRGGRGTEGRGQRGSNKSGRGFGYSSGRGAHGYNEAYGKKSGQNQEEDKQYANFLREKPWLQHPISGTVKKLY